MGNNGICLVRKFLGKKRARKNPKKTSKQIVTNELNQMVEQAKDLINRNDYARLTLLAPNLKEKLRKTKRFISRKKVEEIKNFLTKIDNILNPRSFLSLNY